VENRTASIVVITTRQTSFVETHPDFTIPVKRVLETVSSFVKREVSKK
jgi:hypothetical protein